NATPTLNTTVGANNNGYAVAINLSKILDEAFVSGSPTISTSTLNISTGGGSSLTAIARSGAAGTNVNPGPVGNGQLRAAGALPATPRTRGAGPSRGKCAPANTRSGATPNPVGNPDVHITAGNTTAPDLTAEPSGAADLAVQQGVGRSVATNVSSYGTLASID